MTITQAQLAMAAGVGARFVVELEAGKPTIRLDSLLKVLHALGGTLVGRADDPSAIFYNPSGITQLPGDQFMAGITLVSPETGAMAVAALVEVHTRPELDTALACGADLVGVNNPNLRTFEVALETTFTLLSAVPGDTVLVSESGIGAPEEVARLASAGADAILVGEGLLRHADVGAALRRLLGVP